MRVKCLAQEHNTVTRPGLEPGPFDTESSSVTIRPPHLHSLQSIILIAFNDGVLLSICMKSTMY